MNPCSSPRLAPSAPAFRPGIRGIFHFLIAFSSLKGGLEAAVLSNGDFSNGLNGWSHPGAVVATGEQGVLTDSGTFHSALYQSVKADKLLYTLAFDFRSILSLNHTPGENFPDTFVGMIYATNNPAAFDIFGPKEFSLMLFNADYLGTFDVHPDAVIGPSGKGAGWSHFSISATAPMDWVIPSFELLNLNGQNDDSRFLIDNVSLTVVPEPATSLLLACGAAGLLLRRKVLNPTRRTS
jgi:hypothetical protein